MEMELSPPDSRGCKSTVLSRRSIKAGMEANPSPDLKPNKVPVAKLDAVKDALAIPNSVLAQHLGVTRQTLSAWRAAGEIPTMAALALKGLLPQEIQPVAIVCTLATNIEQLERLRTFLKNEKMAFRALRAVKPTLVGDRRQPRRGGPRGCC